MRSRRRTVVSAPAALLAVWVTLGANPGLAQNQAPVVNAPTQVSVCVGHTLRFDVTAFDPDSGTATGNGIDTLVWLKQLSTVPGVTATFSERGVGSGLFGWIPGTQDPGTYVLAFEALDRTAVADTAYTQVVVNDELSSPSQVRGFYTPIPGLPSELSPREFGVFLFWGASAEANPCWTGYRVRRTQRGLSNQPFELVGEFKGLDLTDALCINQTQPCAPQNFVFTGTGIFFRGFRNNRLPDGTYSFDYPPGNPADNCDTCRVFVDLAALPGFDTDYAVTAIDTLRFVDASRSNFLETDIVPTEVVRVVPSTAPATNLEAVGVVPNPYKRRAEWDPAAGERRIHFIHIPDKATVRIFTASGALLRTLQYDASSNPGGTSGELAWDLRNESGRDVVSGIYIYQVETVDGRTRKGHFVIIK